MDRASKKQLTESLLEMKTKLIDEETVDAVEQDFEMIWRYLEDTFKDEPDLMSNNEWADISESLDQFEQELEEDSARALDTLDHIILTLDSEPMKSPTLIEDDYS